MGFNLGLKGLKLVDFHRLVKFSIVSSVLNGFFVGYCIALDKFLDTTITKFLTYPPFKFASSCSISTIFLSQLIMFIIQGVQIKSGLISIWVIYLLIFTTSFITQLISIYSKCWKWCSFISIHLSTRFTMFLATFLSVLSFFNHFGNITFYWSLPSKFFKKLCLQWA
jgi:hypothetical protein